MDFEFDHDGETGIGWPSYVDFLTSFIFLLLLLVGAMLYLASGDIEAQAQHRRVIRISRYLKGHRIPNYVEGNKLVIQFRGQIVFDKGHFDLDAGNKKSLNDTGAALALLSDCHGIEVKGLADKLPVKNDPEFGNWHLSAERAEKVLRYLYLCTECNYTDTTRRQIQAKLSLSGEGDVEADPKKPDNPADRTVEIIVDCGRK